MSVPKKVWHPVIVESDMLSAISNLTGLSWDELADREVIWFMLKGMRPVPRSFLKGVMSWHCQNCEYISPSGRGGSRALKESVRQHLKAKHNLVRPVTRSVETVDVLDTYQEGERHEGDGDQVPR